MFKNSLYKGYNIVFIKFGMIIKMFLFLVIGAALCHFTAWLLVSLFLLEPFELHVSLSLLKSWVMKEVNASYDLYFMFEGQRYTIQSAELYTYLTRQVAPAIGLEATLTRYLKWSTLSYVTLMPLMLYQFRAAGKQYSGKTHLKGTRIISPKQMRKAVRKKKPDLPFGDVKMPRECENQHVFFVGAPGAGKTTFLNQVIDRIYNRGDGSIIYDFKGDFVSKFYRPDRDFLFNPLDARCVGWNLFNEVESMYDIDSVAGSLVPPEKGDIKFWNDAARDLFYAIMIYLYRSGRHTNQDIWSTVSAGTVEISEMLRDCPGAERGYTFIQDGTSKQALSVHAVLMQYAKAFSYMKSTTGEFSIADWMENPKGNVFIPNYANTQDTLRPILSLFIDLMGRKLLSMPDNYTRRRFFFLDEFGTLQHLSTIVNLLTLGRSKGASVWVGIQDVGQIEKTYGQEIRQTLINACGSSMLFRVADPNTSKYLSDKIGQSSFLMPQESISIGDQKIREGMNLSMSEKTENVILASELQNLPNLSAYVRFVGTDIALTKLKYKSFATLNEGFLPLKDFDLSAQPEPEPAPASPDTQDETEEETDAFSVFNPVFWEEPDDEDDEEEQDYQDEQQASGSGDSGGAGLKNNQRTVEGEMVKSPLPATTTVAQSAKSEKAAAPQQDSQSDKAVRRQMIEDSFLMDDTDGLDLD